MVLLSLALLAAVIAAGWWLVEAVVSLGPAGAKTLSEKIGTITTVLGAVTAVIGAVAALIVALKKLIAEFRPAKDSKAEGK